MKNEIIFWITVVIIIFGGVIILTIVTDSNRQNNIVHPFNADPKEEWIEVELEVSAYCACAKCCGRFSNKITASGHVVRFGDRFIAAPPEISFNTFMIVPGYNNDQPVPVLDRGGLIKENKIDVYFDTHEEALKWGRQLLKVKILKVKEKLK